MSNIEALNQQTDEVKGIVRDNFNKVIERGDRLEHLDEKAEYIQAEATTFSKVSTRLKRKKKCENAKLWLILILILVVIFVVLAAAVVGGVCSKYC